MSNEQLVPKGLDGVVVDKTQMSLVDGANGVLVYRGYNIDEIADCSYEEICHLFLEGELPNRAQLSELTTRLNRHRRVPDLTDQIRRWFQATSFVEVEFTSPGPDHFAVGTHRFDGAPRPFQPSSTPVFTFRP